MIIIPPNEERKESLKNGTWQLLTLFDFHVFRGEKFSAHFEEGDCTITIENKTPKEFLIYLNIGEKPPATRRTATLKEALEVANKMYNYFLKNQNA